MKTLLLALALTPTFTFAGPGVSSGDETLKSYTCTLSGVQDSGYVAQFKNVHGEKPTAVLSVGIGEYYSINLDGVCSRPENVDEFFLNCAFVNGFDIYQATLHAEGSPELKSTVRKINSDQTVSQLACYLDFE